MDRVRLGGLTFDGKTAVEAWVKQHEEAGRNGLVELRLAIESNKIVAGVKYAESYLKRASARREAERVAREDTRRDTEVSLAGKAVSQSWWAIGISALALIVSVADVIWGS